MRSLRVERDLESALAKHLGSYLAEEPSGAITLIVPRFSVPSGFNLSTVRIAIKVPRLYPAERLDLFWVDPALCRNDSKSLPNVMAKNVQMGGLLWQQISWHDHAPHDPNRISVQGYLRGIQFWFKGQVSAA